MKANALQEECWSPISTVNKAKTYKNKMSYAHGITIGLSNQAKKCMHGDTRVNHAVLHIVAANTATRVDQSGCYAMIALPQKR